MYVRERFLPAWVANLGTALPEPDGSIHVVIPNTPAHSVWLTFTAPLVRMQIALLIYVVILICLPLKCAIFR